MREAVELVLATEKDAELLHQMKYEAFLPLYEKYHDDETSPVKESMEKVIRYIQMENSDYYLIKFQNEFVGGVRIVEKQEGVFSISPMFILPEYQNRGIGYAAIQKVIALYPKAITWRLATILQEKRDCHFYEKCGFYRSGWKKEINELMDVVGYEKVLVMTRGFCEADAEEVAGLIIRNFKEVNSKDYSPNAIQEIVKTHDAEWVKGVAGYAHMYVFCLDEKIIGVGSISSFWGSETESILLTVFVLPEFHGKGIGRTIIRTLEQDDLFIRAERVEIPASITAVDFYQKFGYGFKNNVKQLDEEGHFRLEKFKQRGEYQK
ncbi:GNAT family N-acetyltransferase [Novisyntrophococcus fermenticellae]|uniref:GNAT family N-acetyltransferase n=1 Tax=Novisyntrophococcus fermenticellae TaxID=2068655 RepID=UPI001E2CAF9B|nr:GNAT family N-acetyltransferase [Novisyntrophococcus fermenticellae]